MSTMMKTSASYIENPHKKKSAPGGAPSSHINDTPPGDKKQELAERLLEHIGDREHPLHRPANPGIDRVLRRLIAERNAKGTDLIINVGCGYFRPSPDDKPAFLEYYAKEKHRIKQLDKKLDKMFDTFISGRYYK